MNLLKAAPVEARAAMAASGFDQKAAGLRFNEQMVEVSGLAEVVSLALEQANRSR